MNRALFRHGTSDKNIWENVVDGNEYRLPERFEEGALCLDIGGNTGAFTHACIQRGAAKVIAFEPDPDNFHIFRKQLKAEIADGRVEVYPLAVVGGSGFSWRTFSGVVAKDGEINHGGAFLFSEEYGDYGLGKYMVGKPSMVPCIGWDQVVERCSDAGFDRVHLLKLDCEGSEWSILRYSELFGVEKVAGEYHPFDTDNRGSLEVLLSLHFKSWNIVQHPNSDMGLFFATR